jgi:hypothetical protein
VVVAAPRPIVEEATDGIHRALGQGDQPEMAFPQAAGSQRGCATRTVRNMSSRGGVRARNIVLHYTVGPNRPGLTDMDGTTTLANNPAAGVSWHFLIDREGHCYFSVPLTMKAWTQANANPFSVGIEIVNSGRESNLIDGAGKAKLALVISDTARKLDIPLGVGWVGGCAPQKPGVVDHFHLGACGGGHHDLTPLRSGGVAERVGPYVRAAWRLRMREAAPRCAKNEAARSDGVVTDRERAAIQRRRAYVRDRGLRCEDGKPVRA